MVEVTKQQIEAFEDLGAPKEFLLWLRKRPRSLDKISSANPEWEYWIADCAATPEP